MHRKHHAKVETPKIRTARRYMACARCCWKAPSCTARGPPIPETIAKYGHGTPDDWIERNLYSRHSVMGVSLMMVINLVLFGPIGADDLGSADGVDPDHGGRRDQRRGAFQRLPQLPDRRCQHQHRALGHPDRRRGAAQQPPRLRLVGAPVEQVVRVRHRLAVHPPDGDARAGASTQARPAHPHRDGQGALRSAHPAGRDHAPLRRGRTLCADAHDDLARKS